MIGTIDYTSPNGIPVPIGDTTGADAIASWLGFNLQYSKEAVKREIQIFSELSNGTGTVGYQGTGNAFSVSSSRSLVLLECEYIESTQVCLTIEQISLALEEYLIFLESDYKSPNFQPSPFLVEYIVEGNEARDYFLNNGGQIT